MFLRLSCFNILNTNVVSCVRNIKVVYFYKIILLRSFSTLYDNFIHTLFLSVENDKNIKETSDIKLL